MSIVKHKPAVASWVLYAQQRIRQNKNFLIFISGSTGSGKSYSSLKIAEDMDEEFNIERVVFSGLELMNLINSGSLKKGSCIVFEEAGIGMSSKSWQSVTNKMLNFLIQTFRHRNFILIFNSPYMDFVDASTRRLFHAELRTISINFKLKKCKLKPELLQYNSRLQKMYHKYLRVITPEGTVPIQRWNVGKPSPELLKAYEKKKREFTDKLNREILTELTNQVNKGKELTDIQTETIDMLKEGYKPEDIAQKRGVAIKNVYDCMKLVKKKGYVINPIKIGSAVVKYEVLEP